MLSNFPESLLIITDGNEVYSSRKKISDEWETYPNTERNHIYVLLYSFLSYWRVSLKKKNEWGKPRMGWIISIPFRWLRVTFSFHWQCLGYIWLAPRGENYFHWSFGRARNMLYKYPGVFLVRNQKQDPEKYVFIKYHLKLCQKHKYLCDIHMKDSFHLKITILNIVRRQFPGWTINRGSVGSNNSLHSLLCFIVYKVSVKL